jgi:hypothetical protein
MMQVTDYPFGTGDKGMTFGTSTTNSVHIQTMESDGMAATTSRQVLQIGSMLVAIDGRHISEENNAVQLVREYATQECVLTFSTAPTKHITWFANFDERTLPPVGQELAILGSGPTTTRMQPSTPSAATGIMGPRELTGPAGPASESVCTTTAQLCLIDKATNLDVAISIPEPETVYAVQTSTHPATASIAVSQQSTQANEFVCNTAGAACSNYVAANPLSEDATASETSGDSCSKQSRTITVTFGITQTIDVDLDEVRQMTQACFPAAPAVDPSSVSMVLSGWRSM